jgi:hypothetical protein
VHRFWAALVDLRGRVDLWVLANGCVCGGAGGKSASFMAALVERVFHLWRRWSKEFETP